ncbi:hypothetical protein F5Y18DRAFT_387726 [Xylariaceae sp. FL1019]|nr:hypothetical protein F5Y18DRAFT_387726 [Xylariaceae sp. FL1019]
MKAGQWNPKSQEVEINDVPIPEPAAGQFLVKIVSASLCHSDLLTGMRPDETLTMGHEGAGVIEKIHASAEGKGFKVGDVIGFNYFLGCCFECDGCMVHNVWCENGTPLTQGLQTDGFFAEYTIVDYHNAIVLPKELDVKKASPLFCAGITAFHAIDSCELQPGQWIAIVGCGGLGQYATQYAKAMGAKVIGVDINDDVLDSVKELGADAVFNSRTNANYVAEIKKLTGKGCDTAAVFSAAQAAFTGAPDLLRIGGLLMVVGVAKDNLQFSTFDLITGKFRVKGDSTSIPQRMPKAIEFTARHKIQPDVDYNKLEDLPRMVKDMREGKAKRRQVVLFE